MPIGTMAINGAWRAIGAVLLAACGNSVTVISGSSGVGGASSGGPTGGPNGATTSGMPNGTTGSAKECQACAQQSLQTPSCNAAVQDCVNDPSCAAWAKCTNYCFDQEWTTACWRGCDQKFAAAKPKYLPIYQCVCSPCAGPC